MARTRTVVALALLVLVAGLAYVLSRPVERGGYSNQIRNLGGAAFVPAGATFCQPDEPIPATPATMRIYTGTEDKPSGPLELEITEPGRPPLRARTTRPFVTGPVDLRLPRPRPAYGAARLCLRNLGRTFVTIGGTSLRQGRSASVPIVAQPGVVGRKRQPGRIRLEYPVAGTRSRLSAAGDVARRAGMVKASFFGSWTMWAALLMTLTAGVLSVAAVMRGER